MWGFNGRSKGPSDSEKRLQQAADRGREMTERFVARSKGTPDEVVNRVQRRQRKIMDEGKK